MTEEGPEPSDGGPIGPEDTPAATSSAGDGAGPAPESGPRRRRMSRARAIVLAVGAAVIAVAVGVSITAIGATSSQGSQPRKLPEAKPFSLPSVAHPGATVSLGAYDGRPVILNFFASWCHPCQQETPRIAQFYTDHHEKIAVIGIDGNDPVSSALAFMRKSGVTYPVGSDPAPMHVTISYGVSAFPQTFFLNAQHRIVKRVIGKVTVKELNAGAALMSKHSK